MIIVEPPGVPKIRYGLSSLRTIVGVIELNGRLAGSIAFASLPSNPNIFGTPGLLEKSSISLLSMKPAPVTVMPLPYPELIVVVTETAFPLLSTTE